MQPVNKNSFITTLLIATSILGGGALYNQTTSPSTVSAATTETTQTLVYTDYTSFKPIEGKITIVTPSAVKGAPAEKISANGQEYYYNYKSGDRLLYLPVAKAYEPNFESIKKKLANTLTGNHNDSALNSIAQADLVSAQAADSVNDGDDNVRQSVLSESDFVSQGHAVIRFTADPSTANWTDTLIAQQIAEKAPNTTSDYGVSIGRLPNGSFVAYIEFATKKQDTVSDSDTYTVKYLTLTGEQLHPDAKVKSDEISVLPFSNYTYAYWERDDDTKSITMYYQPTDGAYVPSTGEVVSTFYEAINYYRTTHGLDALTVDLTLQNNAQKLADTDASSLKNLNPGKTITYLSKDTPVQTLSSISDNVIPLKYDDGEEAMDLVDAGIMKSLGESGSELLETLYTPTTKKIGFGAAIGQDGHLYYTIQSTANYYLTKGEKDQVSESDSSTNASESHNTDSKDQNLEHEPENGALNNTSKPKNDLKTTPIVNDQNSNLSHIFPTSNSNVLNDTDKPSTHKDKSNKSDAALPQAGNKTNVAVSGVGVLALLSLLIAWFKRQHV